ncbi:MAG: Crp/Fnr family transcriptional regulator [Rhodopila sp.]|nr:Crp/Fnr family transcriptional regulator [Rhodopila sp.]
MQGPIAKHQPDTWTDIVSADRVRLRELTGNEVLFRQNDPVTALYRLEAGRIRLVRYLEDGTTVILHTARSGETFAEASAFADAYHCDAVAEIASRVATVPKSEFLSALAQNPATSLRFARLLASQVRDLRSRLEIRNIRSAPERLMAWLRLRARGRPPTAVLDETWSDVAAEVGLTREAVYRALALLEQDGSIVRTNGAVVLSKRAV